MRIGRVSHSASGVMKVDGKPFFPLGVYAHDGARGIARIVEIAAAGGINLVIASRGRWWAG